MHAAMQVARTLGLQPTSWLVQATSWLQLALAQALQTIPTPSPACTSGLYRRKPRLYKREIHRGSIRASEAPHSKRATGLLVQATQFLFDFTCERIARIGESAGIDVTPF